MSMHSTGLPTQPPPPSYVASHNYAPLNAIDGTGSSSSSSSGVGGAGHYHHLQPHPHHHQQHNNHHHQSLYDGAATHMAPPPSSASLSNAHTMTSTPGGYPPHLASSVMQYSSNGSAASGGFASPQSFHRSSMASSISSSQPTTGHTSSDSATTVTQQQKQQPPSSKATATNTTAAGNKNKRPAKGAAGSTSEPPAKKAATGGARAKQSSTSKAAAAAAAASSAAANGKRKMTPMAAFRNAATNNDDDPANAAASTSAAAAKKKANAEKFKRNSRACTYCQRLKMKCSGPTVDGPCERCRRTGRECMVQERAPRRPWTKKKDLQIQQLTNRLEEMESMLRTALTNGDGSAVGTNGNVSQQAMAEQFEALKKAKRGMLGEQEDNDDEDDEEGDEDEDEDEGEDDDGDDEKDDDDGKANAIDVKPAKALGTKNEITGNAAGPSPGAINNWLTLTNAPSTPSAAFELDLAYVDAHREQLPFVATGKVSPGEAVEMFRIFMHSCVVHTAVLDPEWHTVPRVGDASPFLFAVILYIASTYHRERRSLRRELQEEMNVLIGQAITTGPKSTEVVQAFLLLYQWYSPTSDPAEDRAWLLAGIGIRMATELQLHKALSGNDRASSPGETGRERINRERCWLMTFLVDRSLSIAVGRLWTISDKAEVVRDSDKWYQQPTSRSWDRGISAFADLLKTTARQAEVLHSTMIKRNETPRSVASHEDEDDFDCDTMMRIMNDELEKWRLRWLSPEFFAAVNALDAGGQLASASSTDNDVRRKRSASNVAAGAATTADDCGSSTTSVNTDVLDVHTRTMYYITKQALFRFNFAVLVLNSFGLQYCATRPRLGHARNYCVAHAVRAAQGLVKAARDGLGSTMTYAPHTQFTIVSFAVISLIKLSALVDDVVAQRLIEQVRSCVAFLESIAITSDHTPARLASLVRAMLRRRDERRAQRASRSVTRSKRSESDAGSGVHDGAVDASGTATAPMGTKTKNMPSLAEEAESDDGSSNSSDGGANDDDDDEERKPNYAPGMAVHKLPQRSSRAVTPEGHHPYLTHEQTQVAANSGGNVQQNTLLHDGSSTIPQHQLLQPPTLQYHHQHLQPQSDLNALSFGSNVHPSIGGMAGTDTWASSMSSLPHFDDADVESTLQSLGFMANAGSTGWQQMTADEILDDSFWLRLPERGTGSA